METGGNEEIVAFPGKGKAALGIGHDHYPVVCHDEACGFLCYAHMNQQHFPHAVHPVLCGHQGNKGKQLPVLFAYKIFEGCCINLRRLPFLQVGTSDRHAVTGGITREGRVYAVLLYLLLCRRLEKILYGRILEDLQPRVDIRAGGQGQEEVVFYGIHVCLPVGHGHVVGDVCEVLSKVCRERSGSALNL